MVIYLKKVCFQPCNSGRVGKESVQHACTNNAVSKRRIKSQIKHLHTVLIAPNKYLTSLLPIVSARPEILKERVF